jgi:hypothetical protein
MYISVLIESMLLQFYEKQDFNQIDRLKKLHRFNLTEEYAQYKLLY